MAGFRVSHPKLASSSDHADTYICSMHPRSVAAVASLGALFLLSACASSTSTDVAVESSSASGDVAGSVSRCPDGPPARFPLKDKMWSPLPDGVVGAIYNRTANNIFVGYPNEGLCYIESGGRAAYSVVEKLSANDNYVPTLTISNNAAGASGVCVAAVDPENGYPGVMVTGRPSCMEAMSASRDRDDDVQDRMSTLGEGEKVELRSGNTLIIAQRLEDDASAAKEWTGSDTFAVRDWARIDLTVQTL